MPHRKKWTKRAFLQSLGAGVPTVRLLGAQLGGSPLRPRAADSRFTPLDCAAHFTASPADFGPRPPARGFDRAGAADRLVRTPAGAQRFRGVPFQLGPAGAGQKCWIALSRRREPWTTAAAEIPAGRKAAFLCLAHFCDWDPNESPPADAAAIEQVGQRLAELEFIYAGGESRRLPIRRRFEVNSPSTPWGHLCFAAVPHLRDAPSTLGDTLQDARNWGDLQTGVWEADYAADPNLKSRTIVWLCALPNPQPDQVIEKVRFTAAADDALLICGMTLFHGRENPLRYDRLSAYRITLPEGAAEAGRWKVEVDLGLVARLRPSTGFEPEAWLAAPGGVDDSRKASAAKHELFAEVAASPDAILTLRDTKTARGYRFDLGQVRRTAAPASSGSARVQFVDREKVWLHGSVVDQKTRQATPARLAFRTPDGRYIPPYGHRTEINGAWFQDYGADLHTGGSSSAYVDGAFQVELPVGDIYVEVTKGFEYEPLRKRIAVRPDQREMALELARFDDLRSRNWVSADTHVHFLSPSTAILEGQAEGLNLINLLAAQWGDLFTNVGDLAYGPVRSRDGEMLVWPATENRQHILGHIGLLGAHGAPVYPMSASGPGESYVGDPLWTSLADWTDACRQRGGLAIAVHFPYPTAELAADIVLGKIDAVELWPTGMSEHFNSLRFQDWYRYLNCGYRLPAVSGTDKMSASVAAGCQRVYAYLGQDEFSMENWTRAVRRGNTFMTSGPLLSFSADGHAPGGEIRLRAGGGSVEVRAEARSVWPFHRLEVIWNGAVVASRENPAGAREMRLAENVRVNGPGWLAARCASRLVAGGRRLAAHTSPVYVTVPGKDLFSPPVGAYLLTLIEGAETWTRHLATRPDTARFERVLRVLSDARDILERRMREHGA